MRFAFKCKQIIMILTRPILTRNVHLLCNYRPNFWQNLSKMECTTNNYVQIQIPMPWGHIAGKWWGSTKKRPILVLHGHQDNCGSFDRLLPGLSSEFGFLAIDLPGHGYSSQLPQGVLYQFLDGPVLIRQLIDYFKWPKVSLMGHSNGCIMSCVYTTYLPDTVDMIISLDGVFPPAFQNLTERTGKMLDNFIKYSNFGTLKEPPSYTIEEMEQKLHEGYKKSINLEYCKYILGRNISPSKNTPGKYYFTIDPRLKAGPNFIDNLPQYLIDTNRIKCPVFMSISNGPLFCHKNEEAINVFKMKPNVESHVIQGSHHLHLNEPEKLQKLIHTFLVKHDTLDRSIGEIKNEIFV